MSFQRKGSFGLKQLESFTASRVAGFNKHAALNTPVGVVDISFMEAAAGYHDLSPDPYDYVFTIQRAVVADIPNRNSDAFPRVELHKFNGGMSQPTWATFQRRPVYFEHNQVPKDARGLIFKSFIEVEGPYQVVTTLTGVCKRKDKDLSEAVRKNIRPYWSMGCTADNVTCSVCKKKAQDTREFCSHLTKNLGMIVGGTLCYEILGGITFIELSSVADPAALIAGNGTFSLVDGVAVPSNNPYAR